MKLTTPKSDEVWYVDSGVSNHMTSHKEWFLYLEKPIQLGVVVTGDDTPHPIACRRSSPEPCREDRETHKRATHSDYHEELGVGRIDRRPRNGGLVYTPRVLSLRKKAVLLRKGTETGGCSSSTPLTVAPQCSRKDKKSSQTLTYGTSG